MKKALAVFVPALLLSLGSLVQGQEAPTQLTPYSEMVARLKTMAAKSSRMVLEKIGRSVEGRDLFVAQFADRHPIPAAGRKKPLVMIFAQQHGNETSGKEAALLLCEELAAGRHDDLLRKLSLLIIPQMNPDGSEKGIRYNANNADLNRDHILLSQPETRALHELFFRYWPEVTLDVHEYNDYTRSRMAAGYVRAVDEMFGAVTNPNISPAIRVFQLQTMIPEIGRFIENNGFSFHRYLVGGPPERLRYRYSTTYINDGRNSFGLLHTISFIVEGRRYGDLTTNLARRTIGQRAAILALLQSVAKHADEVLALVHREREQLAGGTPTYLAPRSNYVSVENQPLKLPIQLVPEGNVIDSTFHNFTPHLHVPFYLRRPVGYLIPKTLNNWLTVLERQQVQLLPPSHGTHLVEKYHVEEIGTFHMEEKTYLDVQTSSTFHEMSVSAEDYVFVPVKQLAGHFVCLVLEPSSVMCLLQYPGFLDALRPGMNFPILRVLELPTN